MAVECIWPRSGLKWSGQFYTLTLIIISFFPTYSSYHALVTRYSQRSWISCLQWSRYLAENWMTIQFHMFSECKIFSFCQSLSKIIQNCISKIFCQTFFWFFSLFKFLGVIFLVNFIVSWISHHQLFWRQFSLTAWLCG